MRYELQVTCTTEDSKGKWHYGYGHMSMEVSESCLPNHVADAFQSGLQYAIDRARSQANKKASKAGDEYEKEAEDVVSNKKPEE